MTIDLDRLVHEPSASEGTRIVAVVAHPDDEVLGCGIMLSRHSNRQVVHVTNGAPRNGQDAARLGYSSPAAYAGARRAELAAAMEYAGLEPEDLIGFDVPDQEAASDMATLAHRLAPFLRPAAAVLTHAYEGGHPDHDAVAFAVHAAARMLGAAAPLLIEMPFYRAAPDGQFWQEFGPARGAGAEVVLRLTKDEQALKRRMYDAHVSQAGVLAGFPIGVERFRAAPAYDFSALPNAGLLLYERFGWGLDGAWWLERVAAAEKDVAGRDLP